MVQVFGVGLPVGSQYEDMRGRYIESLTICIYQRERFGEVSPVSNCHRHELALYISYIVGPHTERPARLLLPNVLVPVAEATLQQVSDAQRPLVHRPDPRLVPPFLPPCLLAPLAQAGPHMCRRLPRNHNHRLFQYPISADITTRSKVEDKKYGRKGVNDWAV